MVLQARFRQRLSEKIPPVTGSRGPAIASHAIRSPVFLSSLVSSAFRHGPINRDLCGRSSELPIMCPACRNLLVFTTPMTFGLLNSLSCGEPSSQRRAVGSLPLLAAPTFHCGTAGPVGSMSCNSLILSYVSSEMTYLQFRFFAVSPNPRHSSVSQELPSTQIR
jgi:hypothetical protein